MSKLRETRDFMSGIVWGGLIGATLGLLIAPRSGDETRSMLRNRTEELRRQAMEVAEETKAKAEELRARGREVIEESADRIARTAGAAQEAAKVTWTQSQEPGTTAAGQTARPQAQSPATSADLPARPENTPQATGLTNRTPGT